MNRDVQSALTTLLLLSTIPVSAQIPAFPGAEGFGADANGGRGGDVYTVVNLNNDGAGSLQHGLDAAPAGGRTIVFAVSGYIPVTSDTQFDVPASITIAGQTAPGDGIGLKGGRMLISGDNVIMRHFRIRHGKYGTGGDCLNLSGSAHDSIIDQVTMMFLRPGRALGTAEGVEFRQVEFMREVETALDRFAILLLPTHRGSSRAWRRRCVGRSRAGQRRIVGSAGVYVQRRSRGRTRSTAAVRGTINSSVHSGKAKRHATISGS